MTRDDLRDQVIAVAADALDVTPEAVTATVALNQLSTFNSFRVVDIVERLEDRFGVQVDPADLVPENLSRIDGLCGMFERAISGRTS